MRETPILQAIREALMATGRVLLWRNSVGFDELHRVKYGLGVGSPDLVGILQGGRMFCVEVKTDVGRLSAEQKAWARAAESFGAFVCVARSPEQALDALQRAVMGGLR